MPDIETLRQHMQQLAALTAVFSVDLGEPQFVFNPRWRKNQQVAMNIDGCGDELYLHFTRRGCRQNTQESDVAITCAEETPQQPGSEKIMPAAAINRNQDSSGVGERPSLTSSDDHYIAEHCCKDLVQRCIQGVEF